MATASVVIISKNEADNLKMTVDSLLASKNKSTVEIIVVDDGSKDDSSSFLEKVPYKGNVKLIHTPGLGTSNARNLGASMAESDLLVFCDSHVTVTDKWLDQMVVSMELLNADIISPAVASLYQPEAVGYGLALNSEGDVYWLSQKPSAPCQIPFACSCFMGIRKEVFEDIGGFDSHYIIYGSEDAELSLKAWLFGYQVVINPNIVIKHLFKESYSYKFDDQHMNHNLLWMACTHYKAARVTKMIDKINANPKMKDMVEGVLTSGVWSVRKHYQDRRVHDDDWFFDKFNMPF